MMIIMISSMAIFSGCQGKAVETKTEEAAELPEESTNEILNLEEEIEEPIVITDGIGNEVTLEKAAEEIVVLAPSVLEIIDALGAIDLVVEVDNWSVDESDPLAEGFEGAGDAFGPNIEMIIDLDPDILITTTGGPEEDYQRLKDLGIEVYRAISISGIEGVYDEIANIGKIVGLEDKAEEIKSELKEDVGEIYNKVKDLSDEQKPRVFYESWNDPLMSVGADTFINDIIEKSGGINIVAEDNITGWPQYSVETLIDKNPDVIIAPLSLAVDSSVITEDSRFSSIKAVIDGRVYVVPDNPVSRPNHNVIKALEMFSKAIHPEIFGEFEMVE
jgi:iron complex transport system substrate-binding protein